MAIALVQQALTTTTTITLPGAPVPGNALIAVLTHRSGSTSVGPTSTHGTWQLAVARTYPGNVETVEVWRVQNLAGTATTITIPASANRVAHAFEYSGLADILALTDQTAFNSGNTVPALDSGTTPTTTKAQELWLAGFIFQNGGRTYSTPTNGFSIIATGDNGQSNAVLSKHVAATGAANAGVSISGGAGRWVGVIATLVAYQDVTLDTTIPAASNVAASVRCQWGLSGLIEGVGDVVPTLTPKVGLRSTIDAFSDVIGDMEITTAALVVASVSPVEVEGVGGGEVTLYGTFPVGVPLAVHVGPLGIDADPLAYSGVPGQGYTCYAAQPTFLRIYLPLLSPGVYSFHVESPTTSSTLHFALTIRPKQFRSSVYALRSILPPKWKVGPRGLEEEP